MMKHFGMRLTRLAGLGALALGVTFAASTALAQQPSPTPAPPTVTPDAPPPAPGTTPAAAPAAPGATPAAPGAAPAASAPAAIDPVTGLPVPPPPAPPAPVAPPPPAPKIFANCAGPDSTYAGKPHPWAKQDRTKEECVIEKLGDILGFGLQIPIRQNQEYALQNLFFIAHPVVQIVMIGLAIASVVSWAILIAKLLSFRSLNSRTTRFLSEFRASEGSLQELSMQARGKDRSIPMVAMVEAAANEIDLTFKNGPASTGEKREHLMQRIAAAMGIAQSSNSGELSSGMAFLATTGSIATFVGLFGTVWGIMYSFIGIAQSKSTNLAVVAPGIAEALFATAIGLFAAIPAVVFYNIFSRRVAAYQQRLDNFSGELLVRVSRQLDQTAH